MVHDMVAWILMSNIYFSFENHCWPGLLFKGLGAIWILNRWISAAEMNFSQFSWFSQNGWSECKCANLPTQLEVLFVNCNLPLTAHISWMALRIISCPGYHQWRVRMGQLHLLFVLIRFSSSFRFHFQDLQRIFNYL